MSRGGVGGGGSTKNYFLNLKVQNTFSSLMDGGVVVNGDKV